MKREEPLPGQGIRSLHSWQRLSAARRAVAGDAEAQRRLAEDPAAVLAQLGVDQGIIEVFLRQQADARAPVEPPRDFAGRDLAEVEDDEDDAMPMGGGCGAPAPTGRADKDGVVRSGTGRVSLKVL